MAENCIFCALDGLSNSKKVMEDDHCFVVLDKYPSTYGHMLVISKRHYESFVKANEDEMKHMFGMAKKIGAIALERLGADGLNVATNVGKDAGQLIPHFHIHVIPRYKGGPKIKVHAELTPDLEGELLGRIRTN